jgi:hypothetical protein
MKYPGHPSYSDDDYEGYVTAGRATGRPIPPPSDEDLRRAEEAWNDPAFYNAAMAEDVVTAGWVPKPPVDPNRSLILSEEEIAKLPRWARVAFAARSARRVLPLFLRNWPTTPQEYVTRLVRAVELVERSATHAGAGEDWVPPAGALTCAAYVCDAVNNAAIDRRRAVEVIKATSAAIAKFKDRAENIFDPVVAAVFHVITSHASGAIANGLATSPGTYNAAVKVANAIIRRDFDQLARLAEREKWTDDTPVPPSVFGPMWEGTPPAWWTDDVLAGLPPEPPTEAEKTSEDHPAPADDAVAPR